MNRAWAYVISNPLSNIELNQLIASGNAFVTSWTAHENKLSGEFRVFKNRIILVIVNEDVNNASGCSIDKLTRFIKDVESKFGVELMNRFLVAYKAGETVEVVHSSKIKELLAEHLISEDTVVFNTALANQNELRNWEQPLKTTWLSKYLEKA